MQNKCKKFRLWSILLLVMLMAAGFTCHSTSRDVQAATKNGFRTVTVSYTHLRAHET